MSQSAARYLNDDPVNDSPVTYVIFDPDEDELSMTVWREHGNDSGISTTDPVTIGAMLGRLQAVVQGWHKIEQPQAQTVETVHMLRVGDDGASGTVCGQAGHMTAIHGQITCLECLNRYPHHPQESPPVDARRYSDILVGCDAVSSRWQVQSTPIVHQAEDWL